MGKYLIVLIIILATFLRFNQLNNLPALNADEAAIGYNAYSLLQTGKDEHGNFWPIHFQSFNDYKPGLYFYIVAPFVATIGLNEWAVRIPGAALGVATVFVVYLLCLELFRDKKMGVLVSLMLAISPWHIHFSRGGWEVNAATFFITLGVWSFVKGTRNSKYLWVSVLALVASLYTYHAARIVVPLLVCGLLIYYRRELLGRAKLRNSLAVGIVGLLLLVPLAKDLAGPAGISRASGVGVFADVGPYNKVNQQRGEHGVTESLVGKLLHNKVVNYGLAFAQNYGKHFSGDFLFVNGDEIQRNKVPEFGQMYLLDLVFLVVGMGVIFKSPKGWLPVLLWLVVAPVAAALTFQSPHALRAENMIVPLVIISGYGAVKVFGVLGKWGKLGKLGVFAIVLFMLWDFSRYLHEYYLHMAKTYDYSSQYGVKELVSFVKQNEGKYQNVVVTNRYDQPYILFLFYSKYPPAKFQKEHTLTPRDIFGFSTVEHFDKYYFQEVSPWDQTRTKYPNGLIAGSSNEMPDGTNTIKTIYFPSGGIAFKVVAN